MYSRLFAKVKIITNPSQLTKKSAHINGSLLSKSRFAQLPAAMRSASTWHRNQYSLLNFYKYITGKTNPEKHVEQRIDMAKNPEIKEQIKAKKESMIKVMEEDIRKFFDGLKRDMKSYSDFYPLNFHTALRLLNNQWLETLLFGEEKFVSDQIYDFAFIDDKKLEAYFARRVKESGRFKGFTDSQQNYQAALAQFKEGYRFLELYYTLMGGLPEFFLDQYKFRKVFDMLVVFGGKTIDETISNLDRYVDGYYPGKYDGLATTLDACNIAWAENLAKGPVNHIDLPAWRAMIRNNGPRALKAFIYASKIEALLGGRAPNNMEETIFAATKIIYPQAESNIELAKFCYYYNIENRLFEMCLPYESHKKSSDCLPDISIDGKDVGHAGYHLLKLPIDDPVVYFLGRITNDCTSIDNHSKQCIIDALTYPTNGFLVLLKAKSKQRAALPPLVNGKIDYNNFSIVGQGYIWFSEKDNLVIDSWQNLSETDHNKVIIPMLEAYAKMVTDTSDSILRVLIGKGGKTPAKWSKGIGLLDSKTYHEKMKHGEQYSDSFSQAVIYCNTVQRDELDAKILCALKAKAGVTDFNKLKKCYEYKPIESIRQANAALILLETDIVQKYIKKSIKLNRKLPGLSLKSFMMEFNQEDRWALIQQLGADHLQKMVTKEIVIYAMTRYLASEHKAPFIEMVGSKLIQAFKIENMVDVELRKAAACRISTTAPRISNR